MDTRAARHGDLAASVHDAQVTVREMIYPGEEMRPRPELAGADVEVLSKVRELLVDASTKLDRLEHPEPDREAAQALLRDARDRLEALDAKRLPVEVVSLRDTAVGAIAGILDERL